MNNDATIITLHAGSFEYIGVRHRKEQRLYLSQLIHVHTCKDPGYGKLQIGIYIAALKDGINRASQLTKVDLKSQDLDVGASGSRHGPGEDGDENDSGGGGSGSGGADDGGFGSGGAGHGRSHDGGLGRGGSRSGGEGGKHSTPQKRGAGGSGKAMDQGSQVGKENCDRTVGVLLFLSSPNSHDASSFCVKQTFVTLPWYTFDMGFMTHQSQLPSFERLRLLLPI